MHGGRNQNKPITPPTEPDIPDFDSLRGWSLDHHCAYNDIISRNEKMEEEETVQLTDTSVYLEGCNI